MRTATLLLVVEVAVEDGADLAAAASVAEDRVAHMPLLPGVVTGRAEARTVPVALGDVLGVLRYALSLAREDQTHG